GAHVREGEPAQRCMVARDEALEGCFVAAPKGGAQLALAQFEDAHSQTGSTRISSSPSERIRSRRPKRWDWSVIAPTSAVAPSSGSRDMPAKADPKRSVSRPLTTMR